MVLASDSKTAPANEVFKPGGTASGESMKEKEKKAPVVGVPFASKLMPFESQVAAAQLVFKSDGKEENIASSEFMLKEKEKERNKADFGHSIPLTPAVPSPAALKLSESQVAAANLVFKLDDNDYHVAHGEVDTKKDTIKERIKSELISSRPLNPALSSPAGVSIPTRTMSTIASSPADHDHKPPAQVTKPGAVRVAGVDSAGRSTKNVLMDDVVQSNEERSHRKRTKNGSLDPAYSAGVDTTTLQGIVILEDGISDVAYGGEMEIGERPSVTGRVPNPPNFEHGNQELTDKKLSTFDEEAGVDPSVPVVAELAPAIEDVEERVAQRLQAQLNNRLEMEVENRLETERRNQVVVEAVNVDELPGKENSNDDDNTLENGAKICGFPIPVVVCGAVFFLMMVCFGTVLAFVLSNDKVREGSTKAPTMAPATSLPTRPPTKPPTDRPTSQSPSSSPTNPPTTVEFVRFQFLMDMIGESATLEMSVLEDVTSFQHQTLSWMVNDDAFIWSEEGSSMIAKPHWLLERYVVVLLYFATNGQTTWKNDYGFLSSTDHCSWKSTEESRGVFCNESDLQVERIQLVGNDLVGEIPTEIGLLSNVLRLRFGSNTLFGSIPDEIFNLTNLSSLRFEGNTLVGTVPTRLGTLTALTYLNLHSNSLSGTLPKEIGFMRELTALFLYQNVMEGTIPIEIGLMTALTELDLSENFLTGPIPSEISECQLLEYLGLDSNNLNGTLPHEIGSLGELEYLSLYDNEFHGEVPTSLQGLTNLEILYLEQNDLEGNLDSIFCDDSGGTSIDDLWSDCGGEKPEVICGCCTRCCVDGIECDWGL